MEEEKKENSSIQQAFSVLRVAAIKKTRTFFEKIIKPIIYALIIIGFGFMIYSQVRMNQDILALKRGNIETVIDTPIVDDVAQYDSIMNTPILNGYEVGDMSIEEYLNASKLAKIQYYIDITDKRPANKTFFFGWIKRTMAE